ncbi:hypothetical protein IFT69_25320 [Pseudomonas putida]|jgi:signal transduction histidine kinase|nr:hypothetical protein [Pseudomonas putida]
METKSNPPASRRGARKGENRFSGFQDKRLDAAVKVLQMALRRIRQHRVSFESVTQLAAFISNDLKTSQSAIQLSPSTLLRNSAYRILLDNIVQAPLNRSAVRSSVERAHLEIETNDLRSENRRLRLALEKALSTEHTSQKKVLQTSEDNDNQKLVELYNIIEKLIEASEGQVVADIVSKSIVRSWAVTVRNKTIVDSASAITYFTMKADLNKSHRRSR